MIIAFHFLIYVKTLNDIHCKTDGVLKKSILKRRRKIIRESSMYTDTYMVNLYDTSSNNLCVSKVFGVLVCLWYFFCTMPLNANWSCIPHYLKLLNVVHSSCFFYFYNQLTITILVGQKQKLSAFHLTHNVSNNN